MSSILEHGSDKQIDGYVNVYAYSQGTHTYGSLFDERFEPPPYLKLLYRIKVTFKK